MATKAKAETENAKLGNPGTAPALVIYGPSVTPSQAAAAAALEHRTMAVNGTSNLVVMNASPGG